MTNIIIPGKNQVWDALDPYALADRIPGFSESMDAIKERRENYVKVQGWGCMLELPHAAFVALCNLFPDQEERFNHIYPRLAQLKPEYKVVK